MTRNLRSRPWVCIHDLRGAGGFGPFAAEPLAGAPLDRVSDDLRLLATGSFSRLGAVVSQRDGPPSFDRADALDPLAVCLPRHEPQLQPCGVRERQTRPSSHSSSNFPAVLETTDPRHREGQHDHVPRSSRRVPLVEESRSQFDLTDRRWTLPVITSCSTSLNGYSDRPLETGAIGVTGSGPRSGDRCGAGPANP